MGDLSVELTVAAEDERAKLAEKRRIYAAASAAFNDGLVAISNQDSGAVTAAERSASIAASELQLIASAVVAPHARHTLRVLAGHDEAALLESLGELIPAMHAEPGAEPLKTGDLW